MFPKKKKTGSSSTAIKPENRLLRLLRPDTDFQASLISLERTDLEDACSEEQKMIRNAMLEAEYKKAKALLAFQNNQRFY